MKYTAYNHNGTPLCKPTTKKKADAEAKEYTHATGNAAYVEGK